VANVDDRIPVQIIEDIQARGRIVADAVRAGPVKPILAWQVATRRAVTGLRDPRQELRSSLMHVPTQKVSLAIGNPA
jgi:hypothetical protein